MKKIIALFVFAILGISAIGINVASAADSAPQLIKVDVQSTVGANGQPNPTQKILTFSFNGAVSSPSLIITSGLNGQSTTLSIISDSDRIIHSTTGVLTNNDLIKFDLTVTVPGTQTTKSYEGLFTTASDSQNNFISGHTIHISPSDPNEPNMEPSITFLFTTKSPSSGNSVSVMHQPGNQKSSFSGPLTSSPANTYGTGFGPITESGSYIFRISASDAATNNSALYTYYAGITPVAINPISDSLATTLSGTDTAPIMNIYATQPLLKQIYLDTFYSNGSGGATEANVISQDQKTLTVNLLTPTKTFTYWLMVFAPNGYINIKKGSFENIVAPVQPSSVGIEAPTVTITYPKDSSGNDILTSPNFTAVFNVPAVVVQLSLRKQETSAIQIDLEPNSSSSDNKTFYFNVTGLDANADYLYDLTGRQESNTGAIVGSGEIIHTYVLQVAPAPTQNTYEQLPDFFDKFFEDWFSTVGATEFSAFKSCQETITPTILSDLAEFGINPSTFESTRNAESFICLGISVETQKLGQGERRAVLRDYFNALGFNKVYWDDIQRISTGIKPIHRNLTKEQANVTVALNYFIKIFGHSPIFTNAIEDLSWNTLMYRIRFTRNLTLEASGITKFRQIFLRAPSSPLDWSAVRILGYIKL